MNRPLPRAACPCPHWVSHPGHQSLGVETPAVRLIGVGIGQGGGRTSHLAAPELVNVPHCRLFTGHPEGRCNSIGGGTPFDKFKSGANNLAVYGQCFHPWDAELVAAIKLLPSDAQADALRGRARVAMRQRRG
jgi:hypothetical protein